MTRRLLSSPLARIRPPATLLFAFALAACSGGGTGATESDAGGDGASPDRDGGRGSLEGGGGGPTGDGASPVGDGAVAPGPSGCVPLTVDQTTKVDNSGADTYAWSDARCAPRTAVLFRNDAPDGLGESGGYLRRLTYELGGQTRTCTGTGANGWNGFGYIIDHYASTASETQQTPGQYSVVLAGRHHAIHQYKWRINPGGAVDVTAQWIFSTGRDHPLFSVTFDASPAGANTVKADTRAPYGDLGWDSDQKGPVSGVGWGDKYAFTTTGTGPVTPTSPWDYTKPNVVPYDLAWSTAADAEMGLVATQSFQTRIQGGDYGGGLLMNQWGKTGTNLLTDIPDWEWPYQLNQYELPYVTTSHRVAWGTTYGAVGQSSYTSFGKTLVGYPFQSYAVYVVIGAHSTGTVDAQTKEIEAVQAVTLTASRGSVSTEGPAGVGRTDTVAYAPAGFDPIYAVWDLHAAGNAATVVLGVGSGSLTNPVFRVHGYAATAAPSHVTFGGKTLVADTDYFATVDLASGSLWLTLNLTASGSSTLTIDP